MQQHPQAYIVCLDDLYADKSYYFRQYGDIGYDNRSGMIYSKESIAIEIVFLSNWVDLIKIWNRS